MLFNNLSKFVSHLKNGYLRRKLFVVVPSSVFLLRVLKLMYLAGYISGFQKTKYLVIVYLKYYNGVPVFSNICSFYNKNNKYLFVSYRMLCKAIGFKSFVLISTSKGILTNKDCILLRIGGKVLLEIN